MKIKIIYESFIISLSSNKNILVKDLLNSLKNHEIIKAEKTNIQQLILLDENQKILEENDQIKTLKNQIEIKELKEIKEIIEINEKDSKENINRQNKEIILYLISFDDLISKDANIKNSLDLKLKDQNYSKEYFNKNNINSQSNKTDLLELIKETTGAKEKLDLKDKDKYNQNTNNSLFNPFTSLNFPVNNRVGPFLSSNFNYNPDYNREFSIFREEEIDLNPLSPFRILSNNRSESNNINNNRRRLIFRSEQIEPNENYLNNLMEMGYPENLCRRALRIVRNNVSRAVDLLISGSLRSNGPSSGER